MSSLRRYGIMGVQRRGEAQRGTLSLTFRDVGRAEAIEMVFDTAGAFIGASTEHRTTSIENTRAFVANTVGRLVVDGGRILRRSSSSADVRLSCNGLDLTLTIGIVDDRPLVAFMSVMIEPGHAAPQAD
ncbi:MAG: hypothetical protein FGM24_06865 [Candidatus Kapabacteria bacterium]|nr:hypothetical protein [Candidatus Kapabacteria bacterium]